MKYKAVFSDVDGTLINSDLKITDLTRKAIDTLQDKDIPFVIISARSPSGIYSITREHNLKCPIVAYSGALIMDENGNIIGHKGLDKSTAAQIIDYIEAARLDVSWCIFSVDQWIAKDKNDPRLQVEEQTVKAQSVQGDINSLADDAKINKILCMCGKGKIAEIENELKRKFPDCSIVKSSETLLEIMENNITKATAIEELCALWGIKTDEVIAFGDNYNDIEMLKIAGQGFLMENAPEEIKGIIPQTTLDNNNDGIYAALKKLQVI